MSTFLLVFPFQKFKVLIFDKNVSSKNLVFSNPVSEIIEKVNDCFRFNYQSVRGIAKHLSDAELGKSLSWSFTLILYLYTHLLIYLIAPVNLGLGNSPQKQIPAQIALANGDELTGKHSDALKENTLTQGHSEALNFSSWLWASPHLLSEVSASSAPSIDLDGVNLQGNLVATLPSATPPFAIKSEGAVYINNGGDFDGIPTEPGDDALIYAGNGFNINNNPVLPVQRDAAGNPILDASSKLILVDRAVTVAPGYAFANASNSGLYANLLPPQVVERQTVSVPSYAEVKQQELARRIPTGTPTVTFDIGQNPINSAAEWNLKFPAPGTISNPTVVQVTGGGLNIPTNVKKRKLRYYRRTRGYQFI